MVDGGAGNGEREKLRWVL